IETGDDGTIAEVQVKLAELRAQGIDHVRPLTFEDPPINKPHALNVALRSTGGDVVTTFDAEDEPHADLVPVVNSVLPGQDAELASALAGALHAGVPADPGADDDLSAV